MKYNTDELLSLWSAGKSISFLADHFNVSEKSIIGKLSYEKVYRKKPYVSKNGKKPITKIQLVEQIGACLKCNLEGLEKAPKQQLFLLLEKVKEQGTREEKEG